MKISINFKSVVAATVLAILPLTAQAQDKIRLGYQKLPPLVGLIYAIDAGIFSKNGIELELEVLSSPAALISGLTSGSLDMVGLPAALAVQLRAAGVPVTPVGTSKIESREEADFQIVANADKGIASPKDLEGHVVGIVAKDSPAELQIRDHMIKDGGDPDKVTFVALPFPQLPSAMEVGNVDAIGIAPPFRQQIMATTKFKPIIIGKGLLASLDEDGQAAIGSFVTMKPWLKVGNNKDVVSRFLKSVIQSYRELSKNREALDAILQKTFGMPPHIAAKVEVVFETKSIVAIPSDYAPSIRAYVRTGMAKIDFTAEELVTTIEYE